MPRRLAIVGAASAFLALAAAQLPAPAATPTLRELAAARGLLIGSAVAGDTFVTDPGYSATLSREYSVGVSENSMKWAAVHPGPSTYDFAAADAQVDFLESHSMAVRGHNLAWWYNNPSWLDNGGFDSTQLRQVLRDHISTVVGHYRGRVREWDVVNEALIGAGTISQSVWSNGIGYPAYIDEAFMAARQADPSAKLFYNDFGI